MRRLEEDGEPVDEPTHGALTRQRKRAREYYSVAEVAAKFGLSAMTLYRAIAAGEFPAVKIRGRVIIPARAVDAMGETAMFERAMVDAARWVVDDLGR
jgi:excisionase family DNA binding protein